MNNSTNDDDDEKSVFYDLIVLGGGSGGIAAARRSAQCGLKVLLIDPNPEALAGTCVNRGCIPKKLFWYHQPQTSNINKSLKNEFLQEEWTEFKENVKKYIKRLNGVYADNLEKDGAKVVQGYGSINLGGHELSVTAESAVYKSKRVLIATGSHPILPRRIPGWDFGITSDQFFDNLSELPASIAVVGSGYVAIELAGVMRKWNVRVELFVRTATILTAFDEMIQEAVAEQLVKDGITIHYDVEVVQLTKVDKDITVHTISTSSREHGSFGPFEYVLWAIGRAGNVPQVKIQDEKLHINRSPFMLVDKEFIQVDREQQVLSSEGNALHPGLYAVGDITGQRMLTPVAIAVGRRLADCWAKLKKEGFDDCGCTQLDEIDWDTVPSVLFTHPPCATIGLTEAEARANLPEPPIIYKSSFVPLKYAFSDEKPQNNYKLICSSKDGKIVGLHMFGEASDEALQGFAVAIRMGATKKDFERTIAIHPTSAEEVILMR